MTGRPARALSIADGLLGAAVFLASLAGYASLAARLGQGQFSKYYNLGFDFDPPPFVRLLAGEPGETFGFKHPLMVLVRPLGFAAGRLGQADEVMAGLVMAAAGATTVLLFYFYMRHSRAARLEAVALTALFALSSTTILVSILPETYGFALLSLVAVWLLARVSLDRPGLGWLRCLAATFATGVTITNALQPALAEAVLAYRRAGGDKGAVIRIVAHLARFAAACALLFAVAALLLHWSNLVDAARDPMGTLRSIWWLQTKGAVTGPLPVLQAFLAYSFVAPRLVEVPLDGGITMIDFRRWNYEGVGQGVVAAWLLFGAVGCVASLANPRSRLLAVGLMASLVLNFLFHLNFQFRGSVFLYAAHVHMAMFALACGLAPAASAWRLGRAAYLACVVSLAFGFAMVNVPMSRDFTTRFDRVQTECTMPCR